MKVGRVFSIVACLLISLQICGAINCPDKEDRNSRNFRLDGSTECADACAYVECGVFTAAGGKMEYWGCPDVIQRCLLHEHQDEFTNHFEFINQHNPNALMFKNNSFIYISGCAGEEMGHDCSLKMWDTWVSFPADVPVLSLHENYHAFTGESKGQSGVFWHSSLDGVKGNGSLSPNDGPNGGHTNGNGNGSSGLNSQNGAFKFIGIIAIIWILVAAWIQ